MTEDQSCGGLRAFVRVGYNLKLICAKKANSGHSRIEVAQHVKRKGRRIRSATGGRSENVYVRADGIRLCAHREFSHVRVPRHYAALLETARTEANPCDEFAVCALPDHR